jgi:hypothetical protein
LYWNETKRLEVAMAFEINSVSVKARNNYNIHIYRRIVALSPMDCQRTIVPK